MSNLESHDKFLHHIEYRCALVSRAVYQDEIAGLEKEGLPDATEVQIDEIFDGDYVALFKKNAGVFRTKIFFDCRSDRFILGFAGTNPLNIADLDSNLRQFFGHSAEHYGWGMDIVRHIAEKYRDKFIVTGHSLGGGVATVAALTGGLESIVFNPPCIHKNTLEQIDPVRIYRADNCVHRFVVLGDVLDIVNKVLGVNHRRIGRKTQLYGSFTVPTSSILSVTALFRKMIPVAGPIIAVATPLVEKLVQLHGMEEVFYGLRRHFS